MPAPDTSWFAAKRIIDERGSGTKRKFLVDWEDEVVTGERFTPSWEPKKNLTEALFEEWTAEKPKRDGQPSPNRKSSQHFGDARILTPAAAHVSTGKFSSEIPKSQSPVIPGSRNPSNPVSEDPSSESAHQDPTPGMPTSKTGTAGISGGTVQPATPHPQISFANHATRKKSIGLQPSPEL